MKKKYLICMWELPPFSYLYEIHLHKIDLLRKGDMSHKMRLISSINENTRFIFIRLFSFVHEIHLIYEIYLLFLRNQSYEDGSHIGMRMAVILTYIWDFSPQIFCSVGVFRVTSFGDKVCSVTSFGDKVYS